MLSIMGLLLASLTGCGPSAGAFLYILDLYPSQKVPAQYKLPQGSYLVLVDDDKDLIRPTTARDALVDEMAKRLSEHKISDKVTTNDEIARLRQQEPKYDQRGARELGELAHADMVIWISTLGYDLSPDLEMLVTPGKWAVAVKVLNVKATQADQVRMWPTERDGKVVDLEVSPHDLRKSKNIQEAHELMASQMADEIAKLFYDQKLK